MCGIFGYVGKKQNTAEMILEGLKLLEYRGYDSWGIATKYQISNLPAGKAGIKYQIKVEKHVGKIGNAKVNLPESEIGIGHTRWATHGGVTVENSHPHLDCTKNIAVVHNGIIENYQDLKKELIKKGHKFISETDTEVFPHLLEDNLKKNQFDNAFRLAFNSIKGLNAIVAINVATNEIAAAKTGSPLIVGIGLRPGPEGENEFYIASDAIGILKHTNKVVFLEDNQMVMLGGKLRLTKLPEGKKLEPTINTLDWKFEDVGKGKFEHFLLKEIHEQPQVISNIALNYNDQTEKLAQLIKDAYGTFLLGCGTASYAGLYGTYLFSSIAKRHVNFSIGSEFNYLEDYLTPKSLVIPISQSGETIDIVEPVNRAKAKGSKIASLVNVLGSTLYRLSDYKVLLGAGSEKAVIATKSFTAMISVLVLTAYMLVKKQQEAKVLLLAAAKNVEEILKEPYVKDIQKLASEMKNKEHIYVLGRGLSYATALETTLKIKETTYVHAEGFAGGELKHGVIALVEKGTPCIIIAPNDETFNDIISNAQEVKARGGFIIGIGPRSSEVFDRFLQTDDIKEATTIPQVVIAQLFAYYLALARGITDPDKPRNLAKSVTVK